MTEFTDEELQRQLEETYRRKRKPDPIMWTLEQARRDLIDLTRRNRLLHAPLEGKRPWCLAVSGQNPDDLFTKLYTQKNFKGYAFDPRHGPSDEQRSLTIPSSEQANVSPQVSPHRRFRLQTRLAPDKLQKRASANFVIWIRQE